MLGTAVAQLRFVGSVAFGLPFAQWSLDRLVAAALATQREFGGIGAEGGELLGGPALDEETRRQVQLRRFRAQARRAARETTYYRDLFDQLGLDPTRLRWEDVAHLPLTPKAALRDDPDAFICRSARPVFQALTTGTTGRPTRVAFSAGEVAQLAALSALGLLSSGQLGPDDVVYLGIGGRGMGVLTLLNACARIGAQAVTGGTLEPSVTLARLAEPARLPGKKERASVLHAHPSHLGELLEAGVRLGYRPSAFGLERIFTGGEVVTAGLRARLPALFGDAEVIEGYGMTETFGGGGQICAAGHLHFHPGHALAEVCDPEGHALAAPGAVGTLVSTPFAPFRSTTLLLRYDTEDLVRTLPAPPTCELRGVPAVGQLLGKRRLAVRHEAGWTTPRDLLEALEANPSVPLPARCGMWELAGGVGVEVLVPEDRAAVRRQLTTSLEARGVPLRALHLATNRGALRRPLPMRCDLKEVDFGSLGRSPGAAWDVAGCLIDVGG
jgi:phenylacetate-coenzyme A ligase PaaK-like adenylate-forming protein